MSRKAFICDTLKYRKQGSKPYRKTTLQGMYSITSQFSISHRLIKALRDVCHAILCSTEMSICSEPCDLCTWFLITVRMEECMKMKSIISGHVLMCSLIAVVMGLATGCSLALHTTVKTQVARAEDVSGNFSLVLWGGRFLDDPETIAFLDIEGDQYTIEPYAPDFDFTVKRGVPAKEALKRAEEFVSQNTDFQNSQVFSILDRNGVVIGYEVRPFYRPLRYGLSDIIDVQYWITDKTVNVKVRLKPWIERMWFDGGADSKGGSSR
jgi:hypothetical protein